MSDGRQKNSKQSKVQILRALVPIIAEINLALKYAEDDASTVQQGVVLISKKLECLMQEYGAERISTVGMQFDPARHEAISTECATQEYPDNTIVYEIAPKYLLDGILLAAAEVVVARGGNYEDPRTVGHEAPEIAVREITPFSLGLGIHGSVMVRLIERGSAIPASASYTLFSDGEDRSNLDMHILQGEHELAEENHSLGSLHFGELPPAKCGEPQVEITVSIDADGLVRGRAKILATDRGITFPSPESAKYSR